MTEENVKVAESTSVEGEKNMEEPSTPKEALDQMIKINRFIQEVS